MKRKNTSARLVVPVKKTTPKQYLSWIAELKKRYRATQIKAAVAVNSALIEFYWNLGKDISEKYPGKVRDAAFFQKLSADLRLAMPDATGLSVSNIKYARYFFELYSGIGYRQQVADAVPVSTHPKTILLLAFSSARSTTAFLRSSIWRNSGFQWAFPITKSRRSFPPPPNSPSATPMRRRKWRRRGRNESL